MSDHYYSKKPQVSSNPTSWRFQLRGHSFTFETDAGVFSKNEVDFGSRVLIESFQEPLLSGDFLDVGCGYGPIGLSLAKSFPDRTIEMVDVNERAIDLSKKNAQHNGIQNVRIYESDGLEKVAGEFAAILTNPPIRAGKETIFRIYEGAARSLKEQGELWVVIQKKQGAPSSLEKLKQLFSDAEVVDKERGYWIIRAVK
ncbi:class I SAM-dependent methyltransferase [Paenisporosarcina cavernae]|uniref:Class I SAM-dependent methyltransferase n=1 Tax=Paenisporosarcina cavernae TaxID=2320858 RepID=A0A385YYI2_9BACL|nr:class I SAM-dependent methyltransferase [Paenisporosarcina cavernae]AYC30623.1 class I SAM-dependent methyltransferase [Paenisporosarcina cavernae]